MKKTKPKRETLVTVDLGPRHYKQMQAALIAMNDLKDKPIRFRWRPANKSDVLRLALECLEAKIKEGALPTFLKGRAL